MLEEEDIGMLYSIVLYFGRATLKKVRLNLPWFDLSLKLYVSLQKVIKTEVFSQSWCCDGLD